MDELDRQAEQEDARNPRKVKAAATAWLRDQGFRGGSFAELSAAAYAVELECWYREAEDACRGHLLSPEGKAKGVDPRELWRCQEPLARRWASEELREWWDRSGGRPTLTAFREMLLHLVVADEVLRQRWLR